MEKLKAPSLYLIERSLFMNKRIFKMQESGKNKGLHLYPQLKHIWLKLFFVDNIFSRFCFYLRKHLKYLHAYIVEETYEAQKVSRFNIPSVID